MPDATGRFLGNDEILYVSDTQPATATDPSGYTKVGLLTNNPFSGDAEEITAADKEASGFTSSLSGTRSYSVDVEANRKHDDDAGQAIFRDAWLNGGTIYWLITTNVAGDMAKHGAASVTSYGEDSGNDSYATCSGTLSGQGAPTFVAVSAPA